MKSFSFVALFFFLYFGTWNSQVHGEVFRNRTAFNAASQNLHTVDFESVTPLGLEFNHQVDSIFIESIGGMGISKVNGNTVLVGSTVGEITRITLFFPPGTTAVGCDQFVSPRDCTGLSNARDRAFPRHIISQSGFG